MRIIDIFKEISNYFFIKKIIRTNQNTPEWNKLKLRTGWFGTIYTVINLPPEVFEGEEIYYQVYVVEKIKPITEYLAVTLNLVEVMTAIRYPLIDKNIGQYSYLIKYVPLFRELTLGWVFSRVSILAGVWWLQFKFDIFGHSYQWIESLYHWITTAH